MRKVFKITLWVFAAVLFLILLAIIASQTASVQNYIAQRAVQQLSEQLDTKMSIDRVRIRVPKSVHIGGLYIEDQKQDTLWYSETLTIELDMFGLIRNKMTVHSLLLENVTANINRLEPGDRYNFDFITAAFTDEELPDEQQLPEKEPGRPWNISINRISLKNINAYYGDRTGEEEVTAQVEELFLDINNASYSSIDNIVEVASSKVDISGLTYQSSSGKNEEAPHEGIDFTDMRISDFKIDVDDLVFADESGSVKIHSVSFKEQSGFSLEKLTAYLHIDERKAGIDNLNIKTGNSNIDGSFLAEYPSLESARNNPEQISIDLALHESFLGFGDALLMQPDLSEQLPLEESAGITISASVNGAVNDLTVRMVDANLLGATSLKVYGRITGLPELDDALFDITLEEIAAGRDDIVRLVPPETLPENIVIPPVINLTGAYKGSVDEFDAFIDVRTTFGQLAATMKMNIREGQESYDGRITVSRFDVGRLLGQSDQLGAVSLTASIEGSGFDEETIDAYLDATIDQVYLRGYDYTDIRIDGRFQSRRFTGFAGMEDPNLTLRFNGDFQFTDDDPVFAFEFNLEHADLHALEFMEEEITVSGAFSADFTGSSVETINGIASIRDLLIVQEQHRFPVDSLIITASAQPGQYHILVESDLIAASYNGNVSMIELPSLLTDHINYYFDLHHLDTVDEERDRHFTFNVALLNPDLLFEVFLPGLHDLSPAAVKGSYTGENRNLDIEIDVPSIVYESYLLDSMRVHIASDRERIEYDIRADHFEMPSMKITAPEIYGSIQENVVSTYIALHDNELETVFALGGLFESTDTVYTFSFISGELILNYDRWQVPEENYIRFGDELLYIHNVRLERAGSRIAAQSRDDGTKAPPVEIVISKFDLSDIHRLIENDKLQIAGNINGNIVLSDVLTGLKLNVDLLLGNFIFAGHEVGDIALHVSQEISDRYDIGIDISQQDNRATITGFIATGEEGDEINLDMNIQNINLASIEGFAFGQLQDMSGSITGDLSITGSSESPDAIGTITFRDALFTVAQLNSRLRLENETIAFNREGITLRDVTIVDSNGNRAVLSGSIFTVDFSDYRFALDVRSTNFLLMNTSRRHNELFYGQILIDSDIRIRGDQNRPVINAAIGLKEGTNLTFVVPEQDPEVFERAGIVEFVKMDENHQPVYEIDESPDTIRTGLRGIDITANIEVDLQTVFRVLIDEQAGDYLQVRGGGMLSFGIDPNGLVSLAGRYEFTQGSYQMTFYEISRRRFDIRPGSNIMWTGDPVDAEVDMTAIYTVRASAVDLVADQIVDDARPQFRRVLPFQVHLNMRGNLMAPEISFELDMPEEQRGVFGGVVYQQIQQINQNETERNKQVFALLVLNRFLPENPFEVGEGAGLTGTVRTSASKLLTQQLNALSGRYIRGMDIRFDVESYEEFTAEGPAGRTELQLQVSRRFLEDRLIIELGGQFDIEGERARQTDISDIAGDVAVEYMLTIDGRYRVRGFRKRELTTLGEGEIISTGLSLVYAREFNRFMELFRRTRVDESARTSEIVDGEEDK